MANENSTQAISYSEDFSEALATAEQTVQRVRRFAEDPNTTPKKLRQVLAMLKFANDNLEAELKDCIPVSKRGTKPA